MYGDDSNGEMNEIQRDWLKLKASDRDKLEEFRSSCLLLMNRVDVIFPFHFLKFDIMNTMNQTYLKLAKNENNDKKKELMVECCCSLFSDCLTLAKFLFGATHRQTMLVQIELSKLLHLNKKLVESVHELEDLLKAIQNTFGKTSVNATVILGLLSETYFNLKDYNKSIDFAKKHIQIMDEKKRFNNHQYIRTHLKIALIAEKIEKHAMGLRFLNKLYNHLKKQMEKENNKQKLWENIDILMIAVSISRIKLKMCKREKMNNILKKWNNDKHDYSMEEYIKCKEVIIQNLCLNPVKKTNDLIRNDTKTVNVICWINLLKEFETNFLEIEQ